VARRNERAYDNDVDCRNACPYACHDALVSVWQDARSVVKEVLFSRAGIGDAPVDFFNDGRGKDRGKDGRDCGDWH